MHPIELKKNTNMVSFGCAQLRLNLEFQCEFDNPACTWEFQGFGAIKPSNCIF